MSKTPDQTSRLIILNKHPQEYTPQYREILVSDPMTTNEALDIGKKAAKEYPAGIAGLAFIESVTAPATVTLNCDLCNTRKQPQSIPMVKLLLGIK